MTDRKAEILARMGVLEDEMEALETELAELQGPTVKPDLTSDFGIRGHLNREERRREVERAAAETGMR